MSSYQTLNPNALWVMRINALISGLIISGILAPVRIALQYIEVLNGLPLRILDVILALIFLQLLLNFFLYPSIRFKRWKYAISEERVDIVTGLMTITRQIIPISRIQKIEIASGPIDRRFHLANITILTAAGEAEIRFLTLKEAEKISLTLEKLLKDRLQPEAASHEEDGEENG